MNQEIDIRIDFSEFVPNYEGPRWSWNGGKTWSTAWGWGTPPEIIERLVNVYRVRNFLAPNENNLCFPCQLKGRVGRMKFSRFAEGSETVCREGFDELGSYTYDASVWCRYRIEKCDHCGREESDYA